MARCGSRMGSRRACSSSRSGMGARARDAIGNGLGVNAAVLRASASPWITRGAALSRVGADGRLSPGGRRTLCASRRSSEARAGARARRFAAAANPEAVLQRAAAHAAGRPLRLGDEHRHRRLHRLQRLRRRLPVGEQRPLHRSRPDPHGARHALAEGRRLRSRRRRQIRDPSFSRCPACIARRRPASRFARSKPPCTTMRDSTSRSTIAASARASASRTAPTRCAASTSSATPTARNMAISATRSSRPRTIPTSACARAASWRNAPIAFSASAPRAVSPSARRVHRGRRGCHRLPGRLSHAGDPVRKSRRSAVRRVSPAA